MPLDDAQPEDFLSLTLDQAGCQTVACDVANLSKVAAGLAKVAAIKDVVYFGKPAAKQLEVRSGAGRWLQNMHVHSNRQ